MTAKQKDAKGTVDGFRDTIEAEPEERRVLVGAEYVVKHWLKERPKSLEIGVARANNIIFQFVTRQLLDRNKYAQAARVLWGRELFTLQPRSASMVWEALPAEAKLQILGAGGMGKSYTVGAWLLLDWLRDPEMTCVKVVSVTEEHAKRNVFAHLRNFHANALIPLPGVRQERSIQATDDEKQGLHLVRIPQGDEGKGRLRGFHPVPRKEAHKYFGKASRIRAILDEAEDIPSGVWEDIGNMLISMEGAEHVKVIGAMNPKDRNSRVGQLCEPPEGWSSLDAETAEDWRSRLGWRVLRLDGARCENVTAKKVVYPGMLTWEGYESYLQMGDGSPEYWTMARGWFPPMGVAWNVIPGDFVERAVGAYKFEGRTQYAAAVDLAFTGDRAMMAVGRFGRVLEAKGKKLKEGMHGLLVEALIELPRGDSIKTALEVLRVCRSFRITADWLACDRTGVGQGVYDIVRTKLGDATMGIHWGEGATQTKVLDDDTKTADQLYFDIGAEMWFAVRAWLEAGALRFANGCPMPGLTAELTGRRYGLRKKLMRIEEKKEYKARLGRSPDSADALVMLAHVVRLRAERFEAYHVTRREQEDERGSAAATIGRDAIVDKLEFLDPDD